jgi:pimeloyl-ACP methyl ester carboxylesterase
MSREKMRLTLVSCIVSLVAGCATYQRREADQNHSPTSVAARCVVFVANGAGDSHAVSQNLQRVVAETGARLQIEDLSWSRGRRRYLADQVDHDNHVAQGHQLAARVVASRGECLNRPIYLVGHSAGCAVVLAAAAELPPDSVDRIILLSASVCTAYDLRPALRASRGGIDAFHSEKDRWVLGFGIRIFGTTEEGCRTAAGRVGFTPVITAPADAALYSRLRQHPWDPAVAWSGNDGGHYGTHEVEFLRAYVLPLMNCK